MKEARKWIEKNMVIEVLKEFAVCVGFTVADKYIEEGVEFDGDGQITKIAWSGKEMNGNLDRLGDMLKKKMPRLLVLDLSQNGALKGA